MALHYVWITVTNDVGEVVSKESHMLDFTELLKPSRVAKLYSRATGVPVGNLRVNVTRE